MQIDVLEVDGVYYGMCFSGLFVKSLLPYYLFMLLTIKTSLIVEQQPSSQQDPKIKLLKTSHKQLFLASTPHW